NEEYNERCDAENAKLRAGIVELKSENAELSDRVTKVKQNQLQNDSAEGIQGKGNITPNNNPSNFNLGAVYHEKLLEEKEMDNFLLEAHKKIVSSEIKQRNKERQADRKKLSKAEQASLNQNQESDTRCSTSEKIPEVLNPVTKISARAPGQNSHKKKGAENIIQLIADSIKDDVQSNDKTIPCDVISIESFD
ncbi:18563_t:CDS:1, partial [Rhizophagus irregularis]